CLLSFFALVAQVHFSIHKQNVGKQINKLRARRGLSLDELSELSVVPKSTLGKITAGITTNPKHSTVRRIATALNCRIEDIDGMRFFLDDLSLEVLEIAERYNALDNYGKRLIKTVLSCEEEHIQSENSKYIQK
ncbi:MAG: helix-turn-helix domain-containing protein, partial [Oscillospiraceae bacterium]|nr:helix-turn-helix domain-containing protein [Oscillospiraceae bacterium]